VQTFQPWDYDWDRRSAFVIEVTFSKRSKMNGLLSFQGKQELVALPALPLCCAPPGSLADTFLSRT
jgi:hypothetical protein